MQKALDIKNNFYRNYVDKFGLGLLEPGKLTDNGILWIAMFHMLCRKANCYDFNDAIKFLSAHDGIRVSPGEYKRRPDDDRSEAHDNMVGVVTGSILSDAREIIESICDKLEKTGGVSDHRDGSKWKLSQLRQGSEIAFYQICCKRIPSILDMVWLCGGIIVNILFGNWSSKNLGWLRIQCIRESDINHLPFCFQIPLSFSILIWDLVLLLKYKNIIYSFDRYFADKEHPILQMQRYLNEQGIK